MWKPKPPAADSSFFPTNLLYDFSCPVSQHVSSTSQRQAHFDAFFYLDTDITASRAPSALRLGTLPLWSVNYCSECHLCTVCSLDPPQSSELLFPFDFSIGQVHGHLKQTSAKMEPYTHPPRPQPVLPPDHGDGSAPIAADGTAVQPVLPAESWGRLHLLSLHPLISPPPSPVDSASTKCKVVHSPTFMLIQAAVICLPCVRLLTTHLIFVPFLLCNQMLF